MFIINIFLENNYPLKLIFDNINSRLKYLLHHKNTRITDNSDSEIRHYFLLPYIKSLSEKFKSITRNAGLSLAYTGLDNLKSIIKGHRDPLPRSYSNNVVYRFNCTDCEASYVGQTKRFLKTRIAEHRNHISRSSSQSSVIIDHRI